MQKLDFARGIYRCSCNFFYGFPIKFFGEIFLILHLPRRIKREMHSPSGDGRSGFTYLAISDRPCFGAPSLLFKGVKQQLYFYTSGNYRILLPLLHALRSKFYLLLPSPNQAKLLPDKEERQESSPRLSSACIGIGLELRPSFSLLSAC